jgi:hypothetical protein
VHRVGEGIGEEQEVEPGGVKLARKFLPVFERGEGRGIAAFVRPRVANEARGELLERAKDQLLVDG